MSAPNLANDVAELRQSPPDLITLLNDVKGVASPPHIYLRISQLMQSSSANAKHFEEVIRCDPNLTARLLRIVNSSFYSFRGRIDTVSRAVAVIGMRDLFSLVTAVSAVKSFSKISNDLVNMDTFWRHSVFCGLIARALAVRCNILHSERMFVAGLLHDIGSLIIFNRLPGVARDLMVVSDGNEESLYYAERDTLGFTHAQVGGSLLEMWELPINLHEAVSGHHQPISVTEGRLEAYIVHIANLLANHSEIGALYEEAKSTEPVRTEYFEAIGLSGSDIDVDELLSEVGLQFAETVTLLGIGTP